MASAMMSAGHAGRNSDDRNDRDDADDRLAAFGSEIACGYEEFELHVDQCPLRRERAKAHCSEVWAGA